MPDIEKLRYWSYKQQRLGQQGGSAPDVLKDVIAVYSWHPSASLSLLARVKGMDAEDFYRLDREKLVLRIPAMRLSVHMAPKETAATILAATIPGAEDPYWEKRYGGKIPKEEYSAYRKTILKVCSKLRTVAEIKEVADLPEEVVKFLLNRIAFEGDILRVGADSLRSNILSYVATKDWAKKEFVIPEKDKALNWLAGEYLRAFGPARVKDFQWWAGVTAAKAKSAIAAHETTDTGDGYLLLSSELKAFEKHRLTTKDSIDILPQWDCYTMGYAPDGRERFVSPDMQHHIYGKLGATGGNGLGTVLVNGMAHGAWDARFAGAKMNLSLRMFEKPAAKLQKDIHAKFEEVAAFLNAKTVAITTTGRK